MKSYKLTGPEGNETLTHENGQPVECMYKNPVMLPHPTLHGQVVVKITTCSNSCPAFHTTKRQQVFLACCQTVIDIQQEETPKIVTL